MSTETIEDLRQENNELRSRVEALESKCEELSENYEKLLEMVTELQNNSSNDKVEKEAKALIVGLDAAGKTTILFQYKTGEVVTTVPTEDYNMDEVQHKNVKFQMWDLSGMF
jgi:uncharacterized protein YigA (DUF484 family)